MKISDKQIRKAIRESINEMDAVEFFGNLNKKSGEMTPWNPETKMERMQPGRAARANYIPPKGDFKLHTYQDWVQNYKPQGISYQEYMNMKL